MADSPEGEGSFAHEYELSIRAAELTLLGVVRRNLVTAANADEYAYASCKDEWLSRFMQEQFVRRPVPVRRVDRKPIGSSPTASCGLLENNRTSKSYQG
jgi:hypothetical protein